MANQLIYCKIKNVIYKYPPSVLTLHAFYKLVCYTVLIKAMCVAIFPQKTMTTICLGFCFHTSSMTSTKNVGQEGRRRGLSCPASALEREEQHCCQMDEKHSKHFKGSEKNLTSNDKVQWSQFFGGNLNLHKKYISRN